MNSHSLETLSVGIGLSSYVAFALGLILGTYLLVALAWVVPAAISAWTGFHLNPWKLPLGVLLLVMLALVLDREAFTDEFADWKVLFVAYIPAAIGCIMKARRYDLARARCASSEAPAI